MFYRPLQHPAGRALTSDWFINSFRDLMGVYEINFLLKFCQNFLSKVQLKFFFIDNYYKTIYGSVRS